MKALFLVLLNCFAGTLQSNAGDAEITKLDLGSLSFELPSAIRLRADLATLQAPEFKERMKQLRIKGTGVEDGTGDLTSWTSVYLAWDGVIFLIDNLQMALWVRADNEWKCLISGLRIRKTMGGAPPALPFRYLGGGLFAFSETVPGEVDEMSESGYPQALAATFLLDSGDGKVKDRSESFVYDHNPPVKIPEAWVTRYKLKLEKAVPVDDR